MNNEALEWSNTLIDGKRVELVDAEAAVAAMGEGWRLPTVDELQTILDRSRHSPAADPDRFPDTQSEPYWSSTPCSWDSGARWVVYFYSGYVYGSYDDGRSCVRACRATKEKGELAIMRRFICSLSAVLTRKLGDCGAKTMRRRIAKMAPNGRSM